MTETALNNAIDEMVRRIVDRFDPERIILFGSHASGTAVEDSDIDIMVIMPVEGSRREKANEIDRALADRTVPLDVIVVTPDEYRRRKGLRGSIVHEADTGGRVVYERAA